MERLWTKPFVLMTSGMLFLFTGFYLLVPTLPIYIKQLGGNESQVGLLIGLFTLTAVVFRPVVGGLLDRYGRRPFILWGLVGFAVSMLLYEWAAGLFFLAALRVLHGFSWALSTTAVGTAITDIIPPARRGEGMGWYGLAMTVAMAIGPLLGIWLIGEHSFRVLFYFAVVLSAIALALAYATRIPFERRAERGKMQLFEPSVLSVSVAVFFLAIAYGGITTFLPLFAESIRVNAGTFFLVYAIALTLIRPVAGKLSDRLGEAFILLPSLLVTAGALLVLAFSTGLTGVVVSAVLYGIGFGSAQPALQAATLRLAPPDRKGVANASFFTAFDLGIGLGAIGLGWISQRTGYPELFAVAAGSVVVSLLVFFFQVRRLLHRPEREPVVRIAGKDRQA
ncbi:MFS transporter [Paenibacillus aurantius]|uniref:MFS transporter n=1 Tax=Paenibacillus aurantius TaxID=2918900 RepID=A0AA96RF73_9BACL|nr:MFS transporter [Paenibacillus aurantius]WNQ10963.1 MFS transporter [Paenibacillus aurantius]